MECIKINRQQKSIWWKDCETTVEHERDVLWAICLGNYNREDEFRELVRQEFDSKQIADMVRGGKDCGVIEDYFYDQPEADCEECEEDED